MRVVKGKGSLTHGRGMSESVSMTWFKHSGASVH